MGSETLGLDIFKSRTLYRLKAKQERRCCYPIEEADLLTLNACVLCGSTLTSTLTDVYLAGSLNFFSTSVCRECLYTFRSISPSYQWFKKCWRMISKKQLEVFNPPLEAVRKARYEEYHRLLSKYVAAPSRVLDVGAGYGTGTRVFQNHGYRMDALETEDDKAYYIEHALRMPVHVTPLEEFILPGDPYGLVLFTHCLEHLDDPVRAMSRIRNLVDPRHGILYLEVPIVWNSVTWSDALYLTHKSNFTVENLSRLVAEQGFHIVEHVWTRHTAEDPWDLGLVLKRVHDGPTLPPDPSDHHDANDVRRLYRKGLPVSRPPALETVITYSVPRIDHFYQTIQLTANRLVDPPPGSAVISFESIEEERVDRGG